MLDLQMPGMGGHEFQEELVREGYRIPFIVYTAHGDEEARLELQAPRSQLQAPRSQELQAARGQEVQAPRSQDLQAPRGQERQAPRSEELNRAATLVGEAEAACKAGNPSLAAEKAKAAMRLLKK